LDSPFGESVGSVEKSKNQLTIIHAAKQCRVDDSDYAGFDKYGSIGDLAQSARDAVLRAFGNGPAPKNWARPVLSFLYMPGHPVVHDG